MRAQYHLDFIKNINVMYNNDNGISFHSLKKNNGVFMSVVI